MDLQVTAWSNWKQQWATGEFVKELQEDINKLTQRAMNLSVEDKPDHQRIAVILAQAKQIQEIVKKIEKK